jgi:vacuolar protein sorting-associated protein 13A/C
LTSTDKDTLHLLERTNLSFQVQNSIVPGVWNLARFKIAGNLPTLHLNFSDIKYKTLMTLVDTTIPRFDDDSQTEAVALAPARPSIPRHVSRGVWDRNVEYNVDDTDDEDAGEQDAEHFFDVPSSGQAVSGAGLRPRYIAHEKTKSVPSCISTSSSSTSPSTR